MNIEYAAATNSGLKRNENQDSFYISDNLITVCNADDLSVGGSASGDTSVFAIFDGMGGESCGGKASEIAAQTIKQNDGNLKKACYEMNNAVCRYMEENEIKSMGTTAAILKLDENGAEICNIGDSGVYLFRNGEIEKLSVDHTIHFGKIVQRRALTQYIGIPKDEMLIEPHTELLSIESGDVFLLCSDGLTDMVDKERINEILSTECVDKAADSLIAAALENGGNDNVSLILVRIKA